MVSDEKPNFADLFSKKKKKKNLKSTKTKAELLTQISVNQQKPVHVVVR